MENGKKGSDTETTDTLKHIDLEVKVNGLDFSVLGGTAKKKSWFTFQNFVLLMQALSSLIVIVFAFYTAFISQKYNERLVEADLRAIKYELKSIEKLKLQIENSIAVFTENSSPTLHIKTLDSVKDSLQAIVNNIESKKVMH